ncbi:ABC transporter permease [Nocardioides bruguierae]|uniref:ABC transporter permease n=1 Tax=Nocardioides bruguierae TaxID=2945102 RepID=A0A9X2IFR2_9ACTN|nr:ABC transporter permease [Nocardioides bruguierae]MCL8027387.1 ABC transporter permease [Nocardioides bruguierae]MCM0622101.1 ABC transporter permease [Nocardioides bruguierae]
MSAPVAEETAELDPLKSRPKGSSTEISGKSPLRIAFGRLMRDKIAVVCIGVVALFVLLAIFGPLISKAFGVTTDTQYPTQFLELNMIPKAEFGPPYGGFTMDHPFGIAPRTAIDNLAYWLEGARNSLQIASLATLTATVLGIVIGLLAGFMGGLVDRVLTFVTDLFLTLPFLLVALTIAPIVNERFRDNTDFYPTAQVISLVCVLSFFGWMGLARLIRGEVLSLREREFIHAARVMGMPTRRILVKELLPNIVAPIVVSTSLMLPAFVAAEAGLAYLGVGITSRPSWGQMLDQGTSFFSNYPLYLYEPLIAIVALVLALNLLGDAIRDALDPKTRR